MTLVDYNFNVSYAEDGQPVVQECTEAVDVARMYELPIQFIYKAIYVPEFGVSLILARKEIYIFNQSTYSMVSFDLKRISMRGNLMQFCKYDNDTKMLNLLVSVNDKDKGSLLTVLSLMIAENRDKGSYSLLPISKATIHPSILSTPTDLIDIEYLVAPSK